MTANLDQLDQELMEAILLLDLEAVQAAIDAGASVMHRRKRDNMPVGPMVTPVILSHRMRDVVADPSVRMIRHFPPKVLELLKTTVKERVDELGKQEVKKRVGAICNVIAGEIGL